MGGWRCVARRAIKAASNAAIANGLAGKDLEAYVRKHGYPFGERDYHPYKIWCDEMRRTFPKPKKKPEPVDVTDHPFLLSSERTK